MSEVRIHLDHRHTLFVLRADGLLASILRVGEQRAEAVHTLLKLAISTGGSENAGLFFIPFSAARNCCWASASDTL